MIQKDYYLIAFENTHSAMTAEGILKKCVNISMIPTLREISAGCGISIRFEDEHPKKVEEIFVEASFEKKRYQFYQISHKNGQIFPKEIDL